MAAAGTNAQIAPESGLRIALICITAIATFGAVADTAILFIDFGGVARVTAAMMTISPLIAGIALYCAITRRIRASIAALAVLILAAFVADIPSTPLNGLTSGEGGLSVLGGRVVLALVSVVALVLALLGTRLAPATVLLFPATLIVVLPKIAIFAVMTMFTIGIVIAGKAAP